MAIRGWGMTTQTLASLANKEKADGSGSRDNVMTQCRIVSEVVADSWGDGS